MAVTASIALSSATSRRGQTVTASLTISNGNVDSVDVVAVKPLAYAAGTKEPAPINLGVPYLGPGAAVAIAASGTRIIQWEVAPQAPEFSAFSQAQVDASIPGCVSKSLVFDLGATVKTSDGSTPAVTTTTLTVSSP